MKNLSIEEKAKRYDEAIERAKSKIKNDKDHVLYEDDVIEIFPELKENRVEKPNGGIVLEDLNEGDGFYKVNLAYLSKEQVEEIESLVKKWNPESEDERIRKELIKLLRNLFNNYSYFIKDPFYTECIAWLEKQGEQKSANKVEPKFKEGDWVVFNGLTLYINEVVKGYYRTISKSGTPNSYDWNIDNAARLWTIKDAKDGDVLANDKNVFIYAKVLYNKPYAYCGVDKFGVFKDDCLKYDWSNSVDNIHPATKEQRETLFEKMKLEGYRWDEDEKKVIRFEDLLEEKKVILFLKKMKMES